MNETNFPLWPRQASAYAGQVDALIWAFTAVILVLVVPIGLAVVYFALKYRHGRFVDRSHPVERNVALELTWTIFPFMIMMAFFVWAAYLYYKLVHPPPNALQIQAIGRQWMWKFEHPGGQAEINDLHVPVGTPVRINVISQDVIHGLFIPDLRVKTDVLPGRYLSLWFTADHTGQYRIFCAVFCGTDHSGMRGMLIVMDPTAYQLWLDQSGTPMSLAAAGRGLFQQYGCSGCHGANSTARAPPLEGLYGHAVPLDDGRVATADDGYIRDSILYPNKDVAAGYKPIMPSFDGRIPEEDLIKLIAYIKSLGDRTPANRSAGQKEGGSPS